MKKQIKNLLFIIMILMIISIPIESYCVGSLVNNMSGASDLDTSDNSITRGLNIALSLVRYVGSGVSVIVVLLLGIKYMISSIEDKVEIKKRAVPIVIGCIILFATTNLLVIINNIVGQL